MFDRWFPRRRDVNGGSDERVVAEENASLS